MRLIAFKNDDGDVCEVKVEGVGVLRNGIVDEC